MFANIIYDVSFFKQCVIKIILSLFAVPKRMVFSKWCFCLHSLQCWEVFDQRFWRNKFSFVHQGESC